MPIKLVDGVEVEITVVELWREKLGLGAQVSDTAVLAARDSYTQVNDAFDLDARTQQTDFQTRITALNIAITNTDIDLPAPTLANLATITAIVNELNALRRRQNGIMRAIRYMVTH